MLVKVCNKQNYYPWDMETVQSGVLERPFMLHLLEKDPMIQSLIVHSKASFDSCPDLCRGSIGNGFVVNQLPATHRSINMSVLNQLSTTFSVLGEKYHHAWGFLLGQTNHWIAAVVIKSIRDGQSQHEAILIDSRNNFVLNKSQDQIFQITHKRLELDKKSESFHTGSANPQNHRMTRCGVNSRSNCTMIRSST